MCSPRLNNYLNDSVAHQVQPPPGTDLFAFAGKVTYENVQLAAELMYTRADKSSRLLMTINTFGGDPHQAYRLARAATDNYDHLTVYVPRFCKSAGTLVCLAADEIVMSNYGELGPLDVQYLKKDEIDDRSSALELTSAFSRLYLETLEAFQYYFITFQAMTGISAKTAAHIAARLVSGTMQPVFRQFDPHKIGEVSRMMEIATHYGSRLASSNVKSGAVYELAHGYPSHSYVIDYMEALNLFNNVRRIDKNEQDIFRAVDALSHINQLPEDRVKIGYLAISQKQHTEA